MKEWFAALEEREQQFVLAAAIVVILAVLYLTIWAPLSNNHKRMSVAVGVW